jgi:mRNA interferase MazF
MTKDYTNWHKAKTNINDLQNRPFFHEREIWFCYAGLNVGFEQDGNGEDFLRPILIVKKFNNEIFWAIPLTKSDKLKDSRYYYSFSFIDNVISLAVLSQMKLIDAKRLARQIGVMREDDFKKVKEKLKAFLP